jgi:hypothetical protein
MARKKAPTAAAIRRAVGKGFLEPLFEKLSEPDFRRDLPASVLANRRRRALERLVDAFVSRGSAQVPDHLEREVRQLVREWAGRGFDDGFDRVEDFEIQRARERDLVLALQSGDPRQVRRAHERRICDRVIRDYGTIELRGLQTAHRVLLDLDKVYVPLHLEKAAVEGPTPKRTAEHGSPASQRSLGEASLLASLLTQRLTVREVLAERPRVLIVGAPGSGKTTLIGYLAVKLAAGDGATELGLPGRRVPLVLVVRALARPALSVAEISAYLDADAPTLAAALEEGRAVVFLDGVDEAPPAQREKLVDSLDALAERFPQVPIVVTSRPAGSPGEVERELSFLEPYRLADLSEEDVSLFVDRWCLAAETSVRTDLSEAKKAAEKAAEDLKRSIARSRPVQRIAANPLLASVLCTVHRFLGQRIPEHRVTLYEKCTDALLYEWDRAKFPEGSAIGRLDAPAKRRLLMGVARRLHERHEAELSEIEVVDEFALALPELGDSTTDPRELAAEIRDRSGLLVERRPGHFAFSHLTFQEYLVALDVVRSGEIEHLAESSSDPWWHEVITLTAGMPGANATALIRGLLARNEEGVFLAAGCLETAVDLSPRVRREVEQRLARLVPPTSMQASYRLAELGSVAAPVLAERLQSTSQWSGAEVRHTLAALRSIGYEPAIPTIARLTADSRPLGGESPWTVGEYATVILAFTAVTSSTAKRALRRALEESAPRPEFLRVMRRDIGIFHRLDERTSDVQSLIDAALREAREETPAPRPS